MKRGDGEKVKGNRKRGEEQGMGGLAPARPSQNPCSARALGCSAGIARARVLIRAPAVLLVCVSADSYTPC